MLGLKLGQLLRHHPLMLMEQDQSVLSGVCAAPSGRATANTAPFDGLDIAPQVSDPQQFVVCAAPSLPPADEPSHVGRWGQTELSELPMTVAG